MEYPQSNKDFSVKKNTELNHTQPLTLQKFRFKAENQTTSKQLFSILNAQITEIKALIGKDIPTFQNLKLNIRDIRTSSDYLLFYIAFHNPDSIVASTPHNIKTAVESTSVPRKNEAEIILGVKGNNIYAGIMIANWNSLSRHINAFFSATTSLDLNKTPITNFPNNDFYTRVKNETIIAYGISAEMSLAHLEQDIRSPSILKALMGKKKTTGEKVTGHILVDAKMNPSILSDDVTDILQTTDLEQYLDEDNFLLTSSNKRLYPREFLDRTTYFASKLNDKTILYNVAFDIIEHHISVSS